MALKSLPDPGIRWIVAHRGVSARCPENTRVAFALAVSTGADAIECDLQLTADDRIVVCHDDSLTRFGHAEIAITKSSWQELNCLDVGSWLSADFHAQRLMTLDELLTEFGSRVPLLLELKCETLSDDRTAVMLTRAADIVADHRLQNSVSFLCFDRSVLERLHEYASWAVPVLNTEAPQDVNAAFLEEHPWLPVVDGDILRLNQETVDLFHRHQRLAFCYTCNSVEDVTRAWNIGVDGIITNDPEETRQMIRSHHPTAAGH